MKQVKTFRELQKELNRLYNKLRPKHYDSRWTENPEIRKQIDELLDKKYMEVKDVKY